MIADVVMNKIAVFWDVVPYSLTDTYQSFGGVCPLCLQDMRPEDKGSKFFETLLDIFLPDYMVSHPRR
jgi:hypothetical protein